MITASSAQLAVSGAILTDTGRVRASNEDTVAFVTPSEGDPSAARGKLALVADGMGGHAAGEVASALAAEIIRRVYFALDAPPPDALAAAFAAANKAIFEQSQANPEYAGMGTTCTALVMCEDKAWLAHVGDSRAYLVRDGQAIQLSEDQSLHARMIREGLMTQEESASLPGQNYILQALGAKADVIPAIWPEGLLLRDGDALVLCSDGLSNLVSDADLAEAAGWPDPQEGCRQLIAWACAAGGHDNISVGIFRISDTAAPPVAASKATRRISILPLEDEDDREIFSATTRVIKVPTV